MTDACCNRCGSTLGADFAYCGACGAPAATRRAIMPAEAAWAANTPVSAYAGFWQRAVAWLIDSLIVSAIAFVLIIPLMVWISTMDPDERGSDGGVVFAWIVYVLVSMLTWIIYQVVMTARGGGWGKRMVGIRVVRADNGGLPGMRKAMGRVLFPVGIGFVPFGSLLNLGNLLSMIPSERNQTWHDRVSGTVVIRVPRP